MVEYKVGIIGLGYVGLPLAVESGKHFPTWGLDVSETRIEELKQKVDNTKEVSEEELTSSANLTFTTDHNDLRNCNFYIVTVPTPVSEDKNPDLRPLSKASKTVGSLIKKGDIVVYESTVFPGCTEEVCVPILERESGLKFNQDFFCGYSPERINPGDKEHRISTIQKVTSGSNHEIATVVDDFYKTFVSAGTHLTSSIKVAEAAKVIENSQRDINIAFVNELAVIFEKIGIDTSEVLEAADTKWNFLNFRPGLVGGHCIGVDPYYLTQKAESVGYHPEVILSGRKINDSIGEYIAQRVIKLLGSKKKLGHTTRAMILGITFKENCQDIRNTRVIDIYEELKAYGVEVDVYDPNANAEEVLNEYGIKLAESISLDYEAIILAVAHDQFLDLDWETFKLKTPIIFDVKSVLKREYVDGRL